MSSVQGNEGTESNIMLANGDIREQKRSDNKTNAHTDLSTNCRKLNERKIWVVRRGSDEELT